MTAEHFPGASRAAAGRFARPGPAVGGGLWRAPQRAAADGTRETGLSGGG